MSALDTILSALQNLLPTFAKSAGSIEAKIIDVVATYADSEAIERRNTLDTINAALAAQKVTNIEYYRRKAVAFQIGDIISHDPVNQGAYYANIDPNKQIIKQAYVAGAHPLFTLLVNAVGSDGHLRKLTTDEIASFTTYFAAFQPIGLSINVTSYDVAKIQDDGISIFVRGGTDAGGVAQRINEALLAHENTLRDKNTVSLTEIVDVIQTSPEVLAVGFKDITATEVQLDGTTRQTRPINGIFDLTNGAFTFVTEITVAHIKTLR